MHTRFKKINDQRKYACCAGLLPSSILPKKGKPESKIFTTHDRISCSKVLVKNIPEYYQRKVDEGKNKMNVLSFKNKIIHKIFAWLNQKRPYDKNYKFCLLES